MMDAQSPQSEFTRRNLLKAGVLGTTGLVLANAMPAWASGLGVPALSHGPSMGGTPVKGGIFRVGLVTNGNAETVDVRKAINTPDYCRTDNLYDPLFFQAPSGTPGGVTAGLAVSAEPNKNATVWTIKLRQGVTWHDGKPFTADDVVFTIRSWASPESYFGPLAGAVINFKGVKKLDQYTVQVPLIHGLASFPSIVSWYNGYIVQNGTTNFNKPVGTGPFIFESFTPGTSSTFNANPNYWGGAPHVDQLVVNSSFTDDASRVNAILSNVIDTAPGVPEAIARASASRGGIVLGNEPGPAFIAITMRRDVAPFNDPRVRQACKLLMNREAFVKDVFGGYATVGNDCVGKTLQYWASDIKPAYDPHKAKALLKAAGHESLPVSLIVSPVVPGMVESGTLWAEQAAKVGITAKLRQLSPSVYYSSASPGYTTKQRPISVNYWNVLPPSLAGFYLEALNSHAPYNETAWGFAPGQNKLIFDAMAETNTAKAAEKWHAVQEVQATQGGYAIPANFNYLDAYSKAVHGVQTTTAGNNNNYSYRRAWLK